MTRSHMVLLLLSGLAFLVSPGISNHGQTLQLGAAYFNWYGFQPSTGQCSGGLGSTHWKTLTMGGDVVAETPALGYYCSANPEVIAQQVAWMKEAGITWLLVDWWGWGDNNLDGSIDDPVREAQHRATESLFRYLQHSRVGIRAAISIDGFVLPAEGDQTLGHQASKTIWDKINIDFVRAFPDAYFEWQGKPLVVSFGATVLEPDQRFTYRRLWPKTLPEARAQGLPADWSLYALSDQPDPKTDVISKDGFAVVTARFDTCWSKKSTQSSAGCKAIDPSLADGYFDKNWEVAYQNRQRLSLLLIYTWNEYHERAEIEPTLQTGHLLLDKTKYYWNRLRANKPYKAFGAK